MGPSHVDRRSLWRSCCPDHVPVGKAAPSSETGNLRCALGENLGKSRFSWSLNLLEFRAVGWCWPHQREG